MSSTSTLSFSDFVDLTGSPSFGLLDNHRIAELTGMKLNRIWKSTRTRSRYILRKGLEPFDIAKEVAEKLFKRIGISDPSTQCRGPAVLHTNFYPEGSHAQKIAEQLATQFGMDPRGAFGISYGCTGFIEIVSEAQKRLGEDLKQGEHIPVINVETPDRMLDAHDDQATPIFAAGATGTTLWKGPGHELLFAETDTVDPTADNPDQKDIFRIQREEVEDFFGSRSMKHIFRMEGELAFENGRDIMIAATRESLKRVMENERFHRKPHVIVVPHQANMRMIDQMALTRDELEKEFEKYKLRSVTYAKGMEGMGNTISCTIPSTLARLYEVLQNSRQPEDGDIILTPAAGICVENPGHKMSKGWGAMVWHPDAYRDALLRSKR